MVVAAVVVAVGVAVAGGPSEKPAPARAVEHYSGPAGATTTPSAARTTRDNSPSGWVQEALNKGADALVKGDEAGWMALADPGKPQVRAYFRDLYTSLRGLGVSHLEFQTLIPKPVNREGTWEEDFYLLYCFSMSSCPGFKYLNPGKPGAPMITHALTLKKAGPGDYRVVKVGRAKMARENWSSTPWQVSSLKVLKGKRVAVAASVGNTRRSKEVLAAAERAAVGADRYAGLVGNPQTRYRVYMATDKEWRTWFGGHSGDWAIGYTTFPQDVLSEIVLRMSRAGSGRSLENLIRHEMGHAVTLGGLQLGYQSIANPAMWLQEGVAEYIAYAPRPARSTTRLPEVRRALTGGDRPSSIVLGQLKDNASRNESSVYYGLSHFAVDCLAKKFGEKKLFAFVTEVLRKNDGVDDSSVKVFGTPFRPIDQACRTWIRQQV
ncbi:hypothetical protein AFR_19805 [Actinoplanes friuliensis DSM 7358]|uniref:Peptidase MA-like domain-containing protein n=1 Tax=Actinoplanes friuliensis DSM 7358 TaxID=1246995 RepID=U5VZ31_9ACTN|nr:hypothetical protein AFR_19805 [Actinoplanes friuliensis DSM 7358]